MRRAGWYRTAFLVTALIAACSPVAGQDEGFGARSETTRQYREERDDPPAAINPRSDLLARSPGARIVFGSYVSIQVNVDDIGDNIVGDAGNETSIAVDPLDGDNMVIGWRQFDNVASNFRQAGWAYTSDGGQTWTFPGNLQPGVFRSDPVVDTDLAGTFYYNSLLESFDMDVWRSSNGGVTWSPPVPAFGGDKNWLVVDKSLSGTSGNIYGIWQRFFGCCGRDTVIVSEDGGDSYQAPVRTPNQPVFGTLAVGPDGTLYASGVRGVNGQEFSTFVVDHRVPGSPWVGRVVPLGGSMVISGSPNPAGLLGQANVAVDHSTGSTAGNVYLLSSVDPAGSDPADVYLARSEDGGNTWGAPVRVNNDAGNAWQWFGAHAVAPNGRIDVIWMDTRDTGSSTMSQLYYSYSWDGGDSWFENVPVTPAFDSTVGWPNQNKMGDYITLVSNESATDVAFAATFNGEQDVYYVRLFPDCNVNGVSDVDDLENLTSRDNDANGIPDECEETGPPAVYLGPPIRMSLMSIRL